MNSREIAIDAYSKLHDLISCSHAFDLVPFLGFRYEDKSNDFIYSQQEIDFTRELVNCFNQFAYWLARVAIWEKVLTEYSEDDADALRYEFTKLQLDHCLHFPYQFKSKIVFCATQLCYTRGIAQKLISREEIVQDDKIDLRALSKVATRWPSGEALVSSLQKVDSKEYREQTRYYRNKSQHRHSPRLDFGHITDIVREFPEGALVSYSFGESPPIMTTDVLPALAVEAEKLRAAFFAYRSLIEAHWHIAIDT